MSELILDILIINFHIESLFTCSIVILAGSRNQSFLFLKSFCRQRIMGNRQNSWRTKRLKCSRGQMKRKRVGGGQQMSRYWITCYHIKKKWQLSTPNIFGRHIFLWLPSSLTKFSYRMSCRRCSLIYFEVNSCKEYMHNTNEFSVLM